MKEICDLYQEGKELHRQGVKLISTDEKTGIQAIERKIIPMKPGLVQKAESEYIRHGTKCLISNLEVATGKIIAPSIGDSRTESDFLEHIKATVKEDESAEWIFRSGSIKYA